MASRGTSSTGLGEQNKKSSPIAVPTRHRRRGASKDRAAKTTGEGAPSTLEPPNMTHKFGQKPTLKAPAIFKNITKKTDPSDNESESPSDDGNYTYPSGSENMFDMSDLEKKLPAKSPPKAKDASKKGGSSKTAEPKPPKKSSAESASAKKLVKRKTLPIESDSDGPQLERRGTGDRDSSRRGPSKERTRDGKKSNKDPAKAGGSR
ncbi:hypothetical protein BHYA_0053g00370 [Botrytis hyacinthi]|uniref:Uncharacterized protein n=1 Tax=Botrytis hyacinthi TaxID=278943 RepID=A0A4Z1GVU0_9HELO|nr:hypothetical protein BHYA_0053g00370 [Botrytis hyacinthi]